MDYPKFCKDCGAELNTRELKDVQRGYNAYTGEPNIVTVLVFRCPNEQSSFSEFDTHDVFEIIKDTQK